MKAFRLLGLFGVLLSLTYGAGTARASFPVECVYECPEGQYIAGCNGSLSYCCNLMRRVGCAPNPASFIEGYCTDGTTELIC